MGVEDKKLEEKTKRGRGEGERGERDRVLTHITAVFTCICGESL